MPMRSVSAFMTCFRYAPSMNAVDAPARRSTKLDAITTLRGVSIRVVRTAGATSSSAARATSAGMTNSSGEIIDIRAQNSIPVRQWQVVTSSRWSVVGGRWSAITVLTYRLPTTDYRLPTTDDFTHSGYAPPGCGKIKPCDGYSPHQIFHGNEVNFHMAYSPQNPLIVQSDRSLLLEVDNSFYTAA